MPDTPQQNTEQNGPPEGPPVAGDWKAITPLLKIWSDKTHDHEKTNYEAAHVYRKRYNQLGVPVVMLSAIVGTAIFGTIEKSTLTWVRAAVGLVSVLSTVLIAAQTFLRYGEFSEKHKNVASRYGAIKRDIDSTLALPVPLRGDAKKFLETVKAQLDAVEADAPDIDRSIYDLAHSYNPDLQKNNEKPNPGEPPDEIF